MRRFSAQLATFAAVTLAWVFFRAEQFGPALEMIESMLGLNGIDLPHSLGFSADVKSLRFGGLLTNQVTDITLLPFFAFLLGLVWFAPNSFQLLKVRGEEDVSFSHPSRSVVFLCGILLFWGIKVSFETTTHEFLYFRF